MCLLTTKGARHASTTTYCEEHQQASKRLLPAEGAGHASTKHINKQALLMEEGAGHAGTKDSNKQSSNVDGVNINRVQEA
jgi:hypothetical protein